MITDDLWLAQNGREFQITPDVIIRLITGKISTQNSKEKVFIFGQWISVCYVTGERFPHPNIRDLTNLKEIMGIISGKIIEENNLEL